MGIKNMKKILIDLMKCRNCKELEGLTESYKFNDNTGIKSLIEMALFALTCRKCEDSPCIIVCPQEALEKNKNGIVQRNNNLCIGCKSCAIACPFGTIPNFIVDYVLAKDKIKDINNDKELQELIHKYPDIIMLTDEKPSEEKHIYQITDKVLVKDFKWEEFTK